MYVHEEERIGDHLIQIVQDENPDTPRTWDNLGIMVCSHKRDSYGDKHNFNFSNYESWQEMEKDIMDNYDGHTILPIYMYEHSGVTVSSKPFGDRFDSGRLGLIYCTKKDVAKECIDDENVEAALQGEIETYNQYLMGDVYGYRIYKISKCDQGHEHREELDSCWGFYGSEYCMEEAKGIVGYHQKEAV